MVNGKKNMTDQGKRKVILPLKLAENQASAPRRMSALVH
jgi:hypothetical protein